jgi:hypothetical protein
MKPKMIVSVSREILETADKIGERARRRLAKLRHEKVAKQPAVAE